MDWDRSEEEPKEFLSHPESQQELFGTGDSEHMLADPLYEDLMLKADGCVASLAETLGFSADRAVEPFQNWISTPSIVLRFPLLGNRSSDTIWHNVH
jgi:hypothetical protein